MVLSAREQGEIDTANASGKPTVLFVHGLWLLANSWTAWRAVFEERGYATVAADWPGDAETVPEARAHPESFAKRSITDIVDHHVELLKALQGKPAIVGHSFGGLITQILAGKGLAVASVPIDGAPYRGVLPLPISALKVASVVVANPLNRRRAVGLTPEQFRYGFGNMVSEKESQQLWESYSVPGSGMPLFSAATANFNPATPAKVDAKNPARGPMLFINGDQDHTVPLAIARAAYKLQKKNGTSVTEFVEITGRGHSLTIDAGWREVADVVLDFFAKHYPAQLPAQGSQA
jgi:pimeloyl-ACP methyl ester carboxylesterase